ncbi:MAG: S46 family peptidase [Deltaproteobacteria bacterium]|nr:S46 family peptidase [Deltaproteobacteria bacterium]
MTRCSTLVLTLALAWLAAGRAAADEGMFTLEKASSLPAAEMEKYGLLVRPEILLEESRAVIQVAGGGTGSFVSESGLLVTNHHVAYRCLAALDGTEKHKGLMDAGFYAQNLTDELPCPGYDLLVVEDVRDVTDKVRAAVKPAMKGHKRFEAIRLAKEAIVAACEKEPGGPICEVGDLDGGRGYHLSVYTRIRDVRLVYAPEKDIGKYGGDVDNWMYPRHTGDYTFLRAYADASGKGAPYADGNVPYRPKVFLKVSTEGVAKNDMVMVMGFPARTRRHYPAESARFSSEVDMPLRTALYQGVIDLVHKLSAEDDLTARRYQAIEAGLNNAVKYYGESTVGFAKWNVVANREEVDKALAARLAADKQLRKQYGKVLPAIARIYKSYRGYFPRYALLTRMTSWLLKSVGTAYDIVRWNEERAKPDRDRKDEIYKQKNIYKVFEEADLLEEQTTMKGERALLAYFIREAGKLPEGQRIKAVERLLKWSKREMGKIAAEARKAGRTNEARYEELTGAKPTDDPAETAAALVLARTKLIAHGSSAQELDRALFERRRLFFFEPRYEKRYRDPLLDFARDLAKEVKKIEEGPYRQVEETFDTELRPAYATLAGATYPDANFQIRLTYGQVKDYTSSADGAEHRYMTDLAGVLAKDKGAYPFRVPPALKAAAAADKGPWVDATVKDVPVDFTSTTDTTGGNSGSPVLDRQGRLVGLLFDGTPESILSDWQFLAGKQRSICLDIRYALFLADKVHKASRVLYELGLSNVAAPGGSR